MSGGMYSIGDDGRLVAMTEQPYVSEDLLQDLLAAHPDLLAGDQMDSEAPRRWLLVSRELGLASEDAGSDRWSVDHLFLDQDAIPTIVEVKRSSDTRIRREVVGQMLDYAANAAAYWQVETLRSRFQESRQDSDQALRGHLGSPEIDPEEFWQQTKTNLQAGKVRLVFVADEIPPELHRVVEFLNAQMAPAEVLAVEIKHYVGEGMRTLIPRVIGQSAWAKQRKGGVPRKSRQWDEASFLSLAEETLSEEDARVITKLYAWAKDRNLRLSWGTGGYTGSFSAFVDNEGGGCKLISPWVGESNAGIEISFEYLKENPPFSDRSKRLELLERLNGIPGIDISPERVDTRPSISTNALRDDAVEERFLATLDWAIAEISTKQGTAKEV